MFLILELRDFVRFVLGQNFGKDLIDVELLPNGFGRARIVACHEGDVKAQVLEVSQTACAASVFKAV